MTVITVQFGRENQVGYPRIRSFGGDFSFFLVFLSFFFFG